MLRGGLSLSYDFLRLFKLVIVIKVSAVKLVTRVIRVRRVNTVIKRAWS